MVAVLQAEDLEQEEGDADDGAHGHAVLGLEVDEAEDLAARVEVQLDEGVEPVEEDQLLQEQRGRDLRL